MFEIEIFIVISMILLGAPANALVCPDAAEISPCTCRIEYLEVACFYESITQDFLNRVLAIVRRENNGTLELSTISLVQTNLVELDLTPFEGGIFSSLHFARNPLLSRISGPDLNSTNWHPIKTRSLNWYGNNFQDEGLQTVLNYFNRTEITELNLLGNKLRGSLGPEFLPGFSDLSHVEYLSLSYNNIRVLGGGQFRGMGWKHTINLGGNGLEEIGEDAFLINEASNSTLWNRLSIDLETNSLSDESFHPNSGISNTKRTYTVIYLHENQFTTVKEKLFLDFLESSRGNLLDFKDNIIWCDPSMKWLKDRRWEFGLRVTGLACINDPGDTAFTSCFVDGDCPDITTTIQTTTTGGPLPNCPPYEPSNPPTFYPGISCDSYYLCTEQGPILMNCLEPFLWDQNRKTRVDPSEVDCNLKLN